MVITLVMISIHLPSSCMEEVAETIFKVQEVILLQKIRESNDFGIWC